MTFWNKDEKKKELELVKKCVDTIMNLKERYKNEKTIDEIEQIIEKTFPFFVDSYYGLFKLTLKTNDVTMLYVMIDQINNVCDGNTDIDEARNNIGNTLAEKYLFPKIGMPNKN